MNSSLFKTQVIKLDTRNDNVEGFFDKIRSRISQEKESSSNDQNSKNYEITFILKHQTPEDHPIDSQFNCQDKVKNDIAFKKSKLNVDHSPKNSKELIQKCESAVHSGFKVKTQSGNNFTLQGETVKSIVTQNREFANQSKTLEKIQSNFSRSKIQRVKSLTKKDVGMKSKKTFQELKSKRSRKGEAGQRTVEKSEVMEERDQRNGKGNFCKKILDENNANETIKGRAKKIDRKSAESQSEYDSEKQNVESSSLEQGSHFARHKPARSNRPQNKRNRTKIPSINLSYKFNKKQSKIDEETSSKQRSSGEHRLMQSCEILKKNIYEIDDEIDDSRFSRIYNVQGGEFTESDSKIEGSGGEEINQNSELRDAESEEFQITNQELQRHVSRSNIDIFPNIDIKPKTIKMVSDKILSMRSISCKVSIQNISKGAEDLNSAPLFQKTRKGLQTVLSDLENQRADDQGQGKQSITSLRNNIVKSHKNQQRDEVYELESLDSIINRNEPQTHSALSEKGSVKKESQFKVDPNTKHYKRADCPNQPPKHGEPNDRISSIKKKASNTSSTSLNGEVLNNAGSREVGKSKREKPNVRIKENPRERGLTNSEQEQSERLDDQFQENISDSVFEYKKARSIHNQQDTQMLTTYEHEDSQNEESSNAQSDESINDSIFIVEGKLNDAMKFLDNNELSNLEDFLYDFKDKYTYVINTRVQIKWRLLMAHCKENKKEYERAAINYNQVIQMSREYPKALTISPADVYHRLGVCYTEIQEYNKGIIAFTSALNTYRQKKSLSKYAECMNNLGSLYLLACSYNYAERCFIDSYDIKKSVYGKDSPKLLTSVFNLFESNLMNKNFAQAEKLIHMAEEIIIQLEEKGNDLYWGGLYRRMGRLFLLKGDLILAEDFFKKSQRKLINNYPYCMEYGELMSGMAHLKMEQQDYAQAKQAYDKALMLLNFYYSKDNTVIVTLKRNMEFVMLKCKQAEKEKDRRRKNKRALIRSSEKIETQTILNGQNEEEKEAMSGGKNVSQDDRD